MTDNQSQIQNDILDSNDMNGINALQIYYYKDRDGLHIYRHPSWPNS